MKPDRKRRVVRAFERYVENPPIRALLRLGVPLPMLALLETKGRRTGERRRTPVLNGLVGGEFWIVAEHGERAGYVQNLREDPTVRVRAGRRWRQGKAQVLVEDDPLKRARWIADQRGRPAALDVLAARAFGAEPATVRIKLDPD